MLVEHRRDVELRASENGTKIAQCGEVDGEPVEQVREVVQPAHQVVEKVLRVVEKCKILKVVQNVPQSG